MLVNSLCNTIELSTMERLTINSFLSHGYAYRLWTYGDQTIKGVPSGVDVEDASWFVPKQTKRSTHLFKCALLYEEGGIFTDLNLTCMKRIDFDRYPFLIQNGLWSAYKKSNLMLECFKNEDQELNSPSENTNYIVYPPHQPSLIDTYYLDVINSRTLWQTLMESDISTLDWSASSHHDYNVPIERTVYKKLLKHYDVI